MSSMELMKLEMDKFQNMKKKMEKVVRERDSLKKEVEDLTLRKVKYKTKAREWKELATTLSTSTALIPFSQKRTKKEDDSTISGTKEAENHTCTDSVFETSVQPKSYQLSGTTHLIPPIINKIKTSLRKKNFENFRQSCFGHLLEIGELKIQGPLLSQLLMHMDMAASNKECVVFNINNTRVEFGVREFCLITGLRLGTSEAAAAAAATTWTSSSSIRKKVFMGASSILLKDVEDRLLNASCFGKDGDEMPVKMGLLYFLYGIFLAGNSKQVDQRYLPLIEDLNKFNAFPWGRVAFEFLASSMLSARSRIDDSKGTCTKTNIYGFSVAVQIWAYEVMPSLAAYCAGHANNSEDRIPRILRWSTLRKRIWFRDLSQFFTPGNEAHLVLDGIRASPRELEALTTGTINIPPHPQKEKPPAAVPTTHTIHRRKKKTMLSVEDQILYGAAKPTTCGSVDAPTHLRACVVHAEMQRHPPLVRGCSSSAAADVVILSDGNSDDDEAAANGGFKRSKPEMESLSGGTGSKSKKPCTKFFSMAGCHFGENCHFLHFVPGGYKAAVSQMMNLAPPASKTATGAMPNQNGSSPAAVKNKSCNRFNSAEGEGELGRHSQEEEDPRAIGARPEPPVQGLAASFGASATAKISMDASLVGAIIGKGGVNIKQICRQTGARKLSIRDHEVDPNKRNIELEGTFEQIKQASTMLRELIVSTEANRTPRRGSNLKTKLCENFSKGACKFGDKCHFAHGAADQLRKTGF